MRITNAGDEIIECSACGEPPMTFEEAHEVDEQADKHHAVDTEKHSSRRMVQSQRASVAGRSRRANATRPFRSAIERWGTLCSTD